MTDAATLDEPVRPFDARRDHCRMLLLLAFDALDNETTVRGLQRALSDKITCLSVTLADLAQVDLVHPSGREIAQERAAAALANLDDRPTFRFDA